MREGTNSSGRGKILINLSKICGGDSDLEMAASLGYFSVLENKISNLELRLPSYQSRRWVFPEQRIFLKRDNAQQQQQQRIWFIDIVCIESCRIIDQ